MEQIQSAGSDTTLKGRVESQSSTESHHKVSHEPNSQEPSHEFAPNRTAPSKESEEVSSDSELSEAQLSQTISRRRSHASGHEGEEWAQIERLISRMFGHERKATSEEEKTRHVGVIWRNLTVKGLGLGAALQPTNGDILLGLPRLIKRLLTKGRKGTGAGKPELRTILNDFSVSFWEMQD